MGYIRKFTSGGTAGEWPRSLSHISAAETASLHNIPKFPSLLRTEEQLEAFRKNLVASAVSYQTRVSPLVGAGGPRFLI